MEKDRQREKFRDVETESDTGRDTESEGETRAKHLDKGRLKFYLLPQHIPSHSQTAVFSLSFTLPGP